MTKTLLRIDASIRQQGSYTRTMGDYFEQQWLITHPGARVIHRDVNRQPAPHLNEALAFAYFAGNRNDALLQYANQLCDELKTCTDLLLCCPMYNFGIPSTLKTYLDHVVRVQETFIPVPGKGYSGLLQDKQACLITARGGSSAHTAFDAFGSYLTGILAFMGITNLQTVTMENTQSETFPEYWLGKYQEQIDGLFALQVPAE